MEMKAGTSKTVYSDFLDSKNQPVIPASPASLTLRDDTGSTVMSLTTSQSSNPKRWTSDLSLPDNIQPGDYSLVWQLKATSGEVYTNRSELEVITGGPGFYELDLLFPEGATITDSLKLDSDEEAEDVYARILDPVGSELYASGELTETNGAYYLWVSPTAKILPSNSVMGLYVIDWKFSINGAEQHEYHFLYIVNPGILAYVNELRRVIDKSHIQHPNKALRYNDVDLVAFLNLGLQWINSQPPTTTSYSLANIPSQLYWQVIYAAGVEALSARYLAEGEAAFNFSGQPIQFEVDRTAFIDAARGNMLARLENLAAIKRVVVMSGGGTGGGVGVGNSSGYANGSGILALNNGPTLYLDPNRYGRSGMYNNLLANLGYSGPDDLTVPMA